MDLLLFSIHDSGIHKCTRVVLFLEYLIGRFLISLLACSVILLQLHLGSLLQLAFLLVIRWTFAVTEPSETESLQEDDKIIQSAVCAAAASALAMAWFAAPQAGACPAVC